MLAATRWTQHQRPAQEKKVVILLTGRYAGKKAVIIRNHDDGTASRKYGHAEVLVLTKEPRKVGLVGQEASTHHQLQQLSLSMLQVIKRSSQKTQAKRSFMKASGVVLWLFMAAAMTAR